MRWLSFVRNGRSTYGYVVVDEAGAEGVVDVGAKAEYPTCLLYTSPSPRDRG